MSEAMRDLAHNLSTIRFSIFGSVKDNTPTTREVSLPEFEKLLTTHVPRKHKDGMCWSPAVYANGATRGNKNVQYLTAAVLDIDDGTPIAVMAAKLEDYYYILHTSYSHTEEHPKYRIILPFAEPVCVGMEESSEQEGAE